MKDKVKSFEIYSPKIKLPKKGHTIIELKDCRTGNKQVYEDDNMMTKALEYYFANGGRFNIYQSYHYADYDSMVDNFLGGIFLLDTPLDEDEEIVKVPAGVKMIANGATRVVNNSNPPELGSFSTNESGWIDGDYVQTYDYTNLQGNGTIACACLTSRIFGYMGIGNRSMTNKQMDIGSTGGLSIGCCYDLETGEAVRTYYNLIITKVDFEHSWVWAVPLFNLVYDSSHVSEHFTQTHKLRFEKHHLDLTKYNFGSNDEILEVVEVTVPNDFTYTTNVYDHLEDGKIVHFQKNDTVWTDAAPIKVFIVDETGLTQYEIGNKTGESVDLYAQSNYGCFRYHNGYFFIPAYIDKWGGSKNDPYTMYKIDPSDSSVLATFEQTSGAYSWGNVNEKYISDSVLAINTTERSVLDLGSANGEAFGLPVNCASGNSSPLYGWTTRFESKSDNPLIRFQTEAIYSPRRARLLRDLTYIATINNLSTAVVKDDTKSMKVTYRLTF